MAQVTFKISELNELINNSDSGVTLVPKCTRQLVLTFYQLSNLQQYMKEYLYSSVAKYDSELDAIVLSYKKIIIEDIFSIKNDGRTKVSFTADIYAFKPKVGSVLSGIVNKKSDDHVGCLVHKVFNIAIPRPSDQKQLSWIGSKLKIGQEVQFKVIEVELNDDMPYIKGELIDQIGALTCDNYSVQDMDIDDENHEVGAISGNKSSTSVSESNANASNESSRDYDYTLVEYFLNEVYFEYRKKFSKMARLILNCDKSADRVLSTLSVIFLCDFFKWNKLFDDFKGAIKQFRNNLTQKDVISNSSIGNNDDKHLSIRNRSNKRKKKKKKQKHNKDKHKKESSTCLKLNDQKVNVDYLRGAQETKTVELPGTKQSNIEGVVRLKRKRESDYYKTSKEKRKKQSMPKEFNKSNFDTCQTHSSEDNVKRLLSHDDIIRKEVMKRQKKRKKKKRK